MKTGYVIIEPLIQIDIDKKTDFEKIQQILPHGNTIRNS